MAQYPNNVATLPGITNRRRFGVTLANTWTTELIALQRDIVSTMGSFSTLSAFLRVSRKETGELKPFTINHIGLGGMTASQHHTQFHATTHRTTDRIQNSGILAKGLMTTTQYTKLESGATNATADIVGASTYIGYPLADFTQVTMGTTPKIVMVMCSELVHHWTMIDTQTKEDHSIISGHDNHNVWEVKVSTLFAPNSFLVRGDANNQYIYNFFYCGSTTNE